MQSAETPAEAKENPSAARVELCYERGREERSAPDRPTWPFLAGTLPFKPRLNPGA